MGSLGISNRIAAVLFAGIFAAFLPPDAESAQTCTPWAAKVVSVQGIVQAQSGGESSPRPVRFQETLCPGDTIRVLERSRADLLLPNETLLRLDQNTTVKFTEPEKERTSLIDLIIGAAYFISRTPRRFNVRTPFVNAGVEGTEFFARVGREETFLTVFEGRVLATNMEGGILLTSGMSGAAEAGKAPVLRFVARPRDAVQWTLYYPPILPSRPVEQETAADWRTRASQLLSVGRVEEARAEIEEALKTSPMDSTAYALRSVIAVAQNEKDKAMELAKKAVETDPQSASARIALSYALQARFDLAGATNSAREAVKADPGNALAWARLAELRMSFGDLDEARKAAKRAVELSPDLARTQTVLGFVYLAQVKTKASRAAFDRSIALDQADPLPRLGQGLAMIRDGDLAPGRESIEVAASLDPQNSLIRSYLGKAYYEEKRDRPASGQLEMAKELDPNDPTPWFYDAIRKQTLNRPVEALNDLQRSISLNDNRAVYRSRLLLDEDLAARSASLGRIYDDLGFQQLALAEGWKSVNTDPANYSAHRFLADSYSALPRHETARVSELLQSQLLQPINITPVQPQLSQSKLLILSGTGPAGVSFNEFNPLFNRDRLAFQASGVAGSHRTYGDDLVFSGVSGPFSYSLGQFHYETDGFRTNDDLSQDLYDVFVQASLSPKTSVQAEFRARDIEKGDLTLKFDPDDFSTTLRQTERTRSIRGGFHHSFSPGSDLIGSFIYQSGKTRLQDIAPGIASVDFRSDPHSYIAELQHIHSSERLSIVAGAGRSQINVTDAQDIVIFVPFPPFSITSSTVTENSPHHTNLYVYSQLGFLPKLKFTLGGSYDSYKDLIVERNQFNPKLGLTWTPLHGTTLRAGAFRVLKRTLNTDQTIEPTQVAGFNQFFDDVNGTRSWRYGGAIDQKFSSDVYGGMEYSWRDLDVPFRPTTPQGQTVLQTEWKERLGRAYLYWTPHKRIALSAEYLYERFDRGADLPLDQIDQVTTQRFPVGIGFFHPCGFSSRLSPTYIDQEGRFVPRGSNLGTPGVPDSDRFWIVDASLGYRFPKRYGLLSVEAKNLFDTSFKFQDTDHDNPAIQPKRSIFFKFTLAI